MRIPCPLRQVAIAEIPLTWRSHIQQAIATRNPWGRVSANGSDGHLFSKQPGTLFLLLALGKCLYQRWPENKSMLLDGVQHRDDTWGPRTAQRSENPVENHSSKTQALDTALSTAPIPNGKQKSAFKDHHAEARDHSVMQPECVSCNSFWKKQPILLQPSVLSTSFQIEAHTGSKQSRTNAMDREWLCLIHGSPPPNAYRYHSLSLGSHEMLFSCTWRTKPTREWSPGRCKSRTKPGPPRATRAAKPWRSTECWSISTRPPGLEDGRLI